MESKVYWAASGNRTRVVRLEVSHSTIELPPLKTLVPPHRIELRIDDYKSTVIPFNYKGLKSTYQYNWWRVLDSNQWSRLSPDAFLAGRCLQPLGQLSINWERGEVDRELISGRRAVVVAYGLHRRSPHLSGPFVLLCPDLVLLS